MRQWVELLAERMDAPLELVSVPSAVAPWVRAMYVPTVGAVSDHALLDTGRARSELGYRDVVDVRAAVDELVAWFGENPVDPASSPAFTDCFDYRAEDALAARWTDLARELSEVHGWDPVANAYQ